MQGIIQLEEKTYTEEVTYVYDCSKIKPIGNGTQVLTGTAFGIYDVADTGDPPTDLSSTMIESVAYDATLMQISAKVNQSTGTRGHSYWLVGAAQTDTSDVYKVYGKFQIVSIGPLNAT